MVGVGGFWFLEIEKRRKGTSLSKLNWSV